MKAVIVKKIEELIEGITPDTNMKVYDHIDMLTRMVNRMNQEENSKAVEDNRNGEMSDG